MRPAHGRSEAGSHRSAQRGGFVMNTAQRRRLLERASPFVLMAIIVVLWELICRVFEVSEFVFPAPSAIWARLMHTRCPSQPPTCCWPWSGWGSTFTASAATPPRPR